MKEVKMPSGATLKISVAPFADAKRLYQSLLREGLQIGFGNKVELSQVLKDSFCLGFSSEVVERHLFKCFERCTYDTGKGDLKLTPESFEDEKLRQDYLKVCLEVAKENILPFVNSLYAEFEQLLATTESNPK